MGATCKMKSQKVFTSGLCYKNFGQKLKHKQRLANCILQNNTLGTYFITFNAHNPQKCFMNSFSEFFARYFMIILAKIGWKLRKKLHCNQIWITADTFRKSGKHTERQRYRKKVSIISSGDFVIPFMNLTLNRILQSYPIDYFKGLTNLLKLLINLHLKKVWLHCALARGWQTLAFSFIPHFLHLEETG